MAEDDAKSETKAKIDTAPQDVPDDASDAVPDAGNDITPDTEPDGAASSAHDETSGIEADATSDDETREVKPKAKPRTRTDKKTASEVKADSVPEVKSEAGTGMSPAAPSEVEPDAAPEAVPEAKPKPKARPGPKSNRKVALVTGASGGIGEAFARKLAADGYALVLVARSDGELNRVAGLVTAEHDLPVATVPIDLTAPGAADEVEKEFERRNITPEIVVNNAGFGLNGPVTDLGRQRQIDMVDLNIRMLTDFSLRFIPAMRERGRGGIINIASTAAYMPGPFMAVYYASKAYVLSFSEALATELKGTGITVTTVCPGPTATGFQSAAGMEKAALVKLFPMMSAEEVAELGYEGFRKGKRVVIPGSMNRIIAAITPIIPNRIILPLVRMLQGPRS